MHGVTAAHVPREGVLERQPERKAAAQGEGERREEKKER